MHHRSTAFALLALLATMLASPALAQGPAVPGDVPAPPPAATGTAIELADSPIELPGLGMRLRPVLDSRSVIRERTTVIQLPGDLGNLAIVTRDVPGTSAADLRRQITDSLESRYASKKDAEGRPTETLTRIEVAERPVISDSRAIRPFYATVPIVQQADGNLDRQFAFRGYAVVGATGDRYALLELACSLDRAPRARAAFEVMLATISFQDAGAEQVMRHARLLTGQRFLDGLTRKDLLALLGEGFDEFQRLYEPGGTQSVADDREVGYIRIRASLGRQGELSDRPESEWTAEDRREGLIVRLGMRMIDNDQRMDSQAAYFATLGGPVDQSSEMWTSLVAIYSDASTRPQRYEELGIRDGRRLNVVVSGPGPADVVSHEGQAPEVAYASLAHSLLLSRLEVMKQTATDLDYYVYSTESNEFVVRTDSVSRVSGRPGVWQVEVTPRPGEPGFTATFDESGQLLHSDLPGGRRWEPISIERLRSIWQSKGLPTG